MEIRETTLDDVALLAKFRELQLIDEGEKADKDITGPLSAYFTAEMQAGRVRGWLAEEDGAPVSVCSVSQFRYPPAYGYPSGKYAYIQSVYTKPEYRGKGLASTLLKTAVQAYREQGYERIFLYASDAGRPVYEKQGFETNDHFMFHNGGAVWK